MCKPSQQWGHFFFTHSTLLDALFPLNIFLCIFNIMFRHYLGSLLIQSGWHIKLTLREGMHSNVLSSRQCMTFTDMVTQCHEVQHSPHTEKQRQHRINHSKVSFAPQIWYLSELSSLVHKLHSQVHYSYINRALINLFVHFYTAYNNKKLPIAVRSKEYVRLFSSKLIQWWM